MSRPVTDDDGDHTTAAPDCISPAHEQALLSDVSREHVVGIPDGLTKLPEMGGQQIRVPLGDVTGALIRQLDVAPEDRTTEAHHRASMARPRAGRPDNGLDSANAAYTLIVAALTAVLVLPALAVPSVRQWCIVVRWCSCWRSGG